MKRIFAILLCLLLTCFIFTACESSGKAMEVPDSYITTYIEKKCYEEYEDFSRMNISSEHSYDSETHIDTVLVTLVEEGYYGSRSRQLELKYQYDKSSDLWNLFYTSGWPYVNDCIITLNDSVLGEYDFDAGDYTNFDGTFHLNILSFSLTSIKVDCSANGPCTYQRWGSKSENISMESSGTYELYHLFGEGYFIIDMVPPDGWYAHDNMSYINKDCIEVDVYIDIDEGIHITVYDSIFHD